MILYIQPIFIPDQLRFKQNKISILSFIDYIKKNPYDVKVQFGGWAYNDEWWNEILSIIKDNMPEKYLLEPIRFEKNYGKAYIVNRLFNVNKLLSFKYFLTADSDIIFNSDIINIFERLFDVGEKSQQVTNKLFGYISLEQDGECAHLKTKINENKYYITNRYGNKEPLLYPTKPSGIAGGCLFISKSAWEKVGGYKVMGVYAGDDAYFLLDINRLGFSYQMSPNISIIHPFQNDPDWAKHKVKLLRNGSTNGKNRGIKELLKAVEIYDKYWDERNN